VLQVWGTDVELARRAPKLVRPLVRGARVVVAASSYLADEARALGARDVAVVPPPIRLPESIGEPAEPPHVLFAGRLSEEKGILEFLEATDGFERVVVGDGPLRAQVPEALGFVAPTELGSYYERAAVVCVPSRREGYGITAREALAYGRPVVATRVGGLADLVGAGVRFVEVGDSAALRSDIDELLREPELRLSLGRQARARAAAWLGDASSSLAAVYHEVVEAERIKTCDP
jgi:glycosyltransferase involved in cell wall biosynthesis